MRASASSLKGLVITPLSERLTLSTAAHWASILIVRCRTPTPPSRAIAIAILASVTVSIGEDTIGTLRRMPGKN